jgi:radical SAM superfamily enzyme YgiQ (UPF0313 family)
MKRLSTPIDAIFVGYEDQENLGLRYIMSYLKKRGFSSLLIPFARSKIPDLVKTVQSYHPKVIGFSIIFQYTVKDFAELAKALREADIEAHFTAGGHFPTVLPRTLFEIIPQLDSIVMFEGELTSAELLRKLDKPNLWPTIQGLAFRKGQEIIINPPRPLIPDLSILPYPLRDKPGYLSRGVKIASILSSRGCLYNCSYCSIRQFYGGAPGKLRRIRSPESVVQEMKDLHENDGVRFFIFQDDDFAAKSYRQRQWIKMFLDELDKTGLTGKIRWKISCRVDDIDLELLRYCRDHGLIAVFLGVESGNPDGLRTCNKLVTVDQNISAINTLKNIGVTFNMGFMLFDPNSTLETVSQNLDFLRRTLGDGSCAINFCKMLPYGGTPIEKRLRQEGRLKGSIDQPDYSFLEPRIDWYAFFVARSFRIRNFDSLGLIERIGVAKLDHTLAQEFKPANETEKYGKELKDITMRANSIALDVLERVLDFVKTRKINEIITDWSLLRLISERLWIEDIRLQNEMDKVLSIYNPILLEGYKKEFYRRSQTSFGSVQSNSQI